jgi:S-adenosylmethionine hydrolase
MGTPRLLTLTTDFGIQDSYVAQMKGAALSVAPDLRIVDLCHEVPPQQIAAGAYVLETGYAAFPEGTVHLAVVDPGVGTARRAIAMRSERFVFVAPDNGLLTRVLEKEPPVEVHAIEPEAYTSAASSATFEGRDRFAPAAAWIARGLPLSELGPAVRDPVRLALPQPEPRPGLPLRVPVILIDRFGNVVLDLPAEAAASALGRPLDEDATVLVSTPGGIVSRFRRTYGLPSSGEPFMLVNSAGYLELALAGSRADKRLDLRPGAFVELTLGDADG